MYDPREVFEKVKCENCEAFKFSDDNEITYCVEGSQDPCFQQYVLEQNKLMLTVLIKARELNLPNLDKEDVETFILIDDTIEQITQKKIEVL